MKVLIGAYACTPNTGSEGGVGWNWTVQAARHGHDVHVITRSNNRAVIQEELRIRPIERLTFHYYDLPVPLPAWKKRGGYYALLAYYYFWQLGVSAVARRLDREHRFDLTHHVTFVNDWMPAGVGWTGSPFVWGPVGGSTNIIPRNLRQFIPRDARRYESIRRTMQVLLRSADPFVALTRRRADVILTFTAEAVSGIPAPHRRKSTARRPHRCLVVRARRAYDRAREKRSVHDRVREPAGALEGVRPADRGLRAVPSCR